MIQNRRRTFPFSRPPKEQPLARERTELENVVRFLQEELDVLRNELNELQSATDSSTTGALSELSLRVLAVEQAIAAFQSILNGLTGLFQPLDDDLTSISAMATQGYVRRLIGSVWQTVATIPWTDLSGVPTTIAGFGITDAYTKTEVDALLASSGGSGDYTIPCAVMGG